MMAYALRYGEQEILYGSVRRRMAYQRHLGALERRAARSSTVSPWQGPAPQRRYRGLTVGQDHGSGRHTARLRPRQEVGRQKAPFARRHRRFGAQSQSTQRQVLKAKVHSAKVPDE